MIKWICLKELELIWINLKSLSILTTGFYKWMHDLHCCFWKETSLFKFKMKSHSTTKIWADGRCLVTKYQLKLLKRGDRNASWEPHGCALCQYIYKSLLLPEPRDTWGWSILWSPSQRRYQRRRSRCSPGMKPGPTQRPLPRKGWSPAPLPRDSRME